MEAIYLICWIVIPVAVAILATARFKYEAARSFDRHVSQALSPFDRK